MAVDRPVPARETADGTTAPAVSSLVAPGSSTVAEDVLCQSFAWAINGGWSVVTRDEDKNRA